MEGNSNRCRTKIGRELSNSNTCKNKYDTMRKDWRHWKSLKQSETGIGWDPKSGKIDATNEWWQRKIKVCKNHNLIYYIIFILTIIV